jgi:hypothetical protein
LLHKLDTLQGNEERLALLKSVHTESKLLENIVSDAIRRQDQLGIATELENTTQTDEDQQQTADKGKQKESTPAGDPAAQTDLLIDAVAAAAPETRLGRTNWQHLMARRAAMVNRLREVIELQHRAAFYLGDFYHQAQNRDEETRWYDEAEKLRKRLLKGVFWSKWLFLGAYLLVEYELKAKKFMDMSREFLKRPAGNSRALDRCDRGGIMTDDIVCFFSAALPLCMLIIYFS